MPHLRDAIQDVGVMPMAMVDPTFVESLIALGSHLFRHGYRFITVTPSTHARVLRRRGGGLASSLRDIFGWNLPFTPDILPRVLHERLRSNGLVREGEDGWHSNVRFSSIGDQLYAHDAYPTLAPDAVFFGPDTYRFVAAIRRRLHPCRLLVDVCCGAGPGGLEVAGTLAEQVVLADLSPRALTFAAANRALAVRPAVSLHQGDLLHALPERPDAIIANPPYLADSLGRTYRHGGGARGIDLSVRVVAEAIARLAPGGQLLLYTGTPIVAGIDCFATAAQPLIAHAGCTWDYEELDPDVFGEELESPAYAEVDRIAAVLLSITIPGP